MNYSCSLFFGENLPTGENRGTSGAASLTEGRHRNSEYCEINT